MKAKTKGEQKFTTNIHKNKTRIKEIKIFPKAINATDLLSDVKPR